MWNCIIPDMMRSKLKYELNHTNTSGIYIYIILYDMVGHVSFDIEI